MAKTTSLYRILSDIPNCSKQKILSLANRRCRHNHSLLEHPQCLKEYLRLPPEKLGFLDIETVQLNADWGIILSYCIKKLDGDIIFDTINYNDIQEFFTEGENHIQWDKRVVQTLCENIFKFDKLIVYWGKNNRFDIPYIRTKAVKYGIKFPIHREMLVNDLYDIVKTRLKLANNRLETACRYFNIPTKEHRLNSGVSYRALHGHKPSLMHILEHNKEDVISTEILWKKLYPYYTNPNTSI